MNNFFNKDYFIVEMVIILLFVSTSVSKDTIKKIGHRIGVSSVI